MLIEDGKIREVRPNIAVSGDAAAVIDATNRIVLPGFIDTHHHFYQGLLRNILTNGLLNPDYSRDIGNTLTPAYAPADAYAGVLVTALGMIDMGTTTAVDTSQVSHTPEHSDACIRALQESGHPRGLRLLARQRTRCALPAGHRPAAAELFQLPGPAAHAGDGIEPRPQDLRLRARGRRAHRLARRQQQHRADAHRARPRRPAAAGRRIHPLHAFERRGVAPAQGYRRPGSRSPLRSRWRWATACRPFKTRSITASGRR